MKKILSAIVASAALVTGAIVVTLQRPAMPEDGVDAATVTESITAMPRPRVALWLIATSAIPATEIGTCRYVEVGLIRDQSDAGDAPMQTVWQWCPKPEGEATPDQPNLADRWCRFSARRLCYGDADAGEVELTQEEKVCFRRSVDACMEAAQGAGHVVWWSEPFAAPDGAGELTRLVRRDQAALMCACTDSHDAGLCRVWRDGADAARPLPPGDLAQPGKWVGKGCVVSPCAESLLVRKEPGDQYPEECRP